MVVVPLEQIKSLVQESVRVEIQSAEKRILEKLDEKFGSFQEDAFPPGPLHKHKEYHESKIDSAETAKKIKNDLIGWAVKGIVTIMLALMGWGALDYLGKALK